MIYDLQEDQGYSLKKTAPPAALGLGGVGVGIYFTTLIATSPVSGGLGIFLMVLSAGVGGYMTYQSGQMPKYLNERFFKMPSNYNGFSDSDESIEQSVSFGKSNELP